MAFSLADMLRYLNGGHKKEKSIFRSEREAYDFCRNLYKDSGGVTPELRRAYEFYLKNSMTMEAEGYSPKAERQIDTRTGENISRTEALGETQSLKK